MPSLQSYYTPALSANTSAELAEMVTDETGTGLLVLNNSPTLAGTPTTPTPSAGDNSTTIANTAYVNQYINNKITVSAVEPSNPSVADVWVVLPG